ncbi:MAG: RNA polymerase sigma factor [Solirubrobacteraceae bacterium]
MEASTAARTAVLPASRASGLRSQRLLRLASDDRLVALVRAGNQAAFETLYDRHHRPLLSFCRHMLADRGESEDAVQHTFIAAYNDLAGSDKEIQLRAWLYAIARNRCLTMLRARREQPTGEELEVATEGLADEVERRSDLQQLLGDMRELPEEQRAALVLAEIGALSHDEIAEVVGVPKAKVKALVFQARSSLIASRDARDMSCQTVREELSTARGGVLRRGPLRRHLAGCDGCREFAGHVKHQRTALAIVLPVIPTLGLKHGALSAVIGTGAAGGGGAAAVTAAGGGAAFIGSKGLAAKVLLGAALATGGVAGTAAVVHEVDSGALTSPVRAHHATAAHRGLPAGLGHAVGLATAQSRASKGAPGTAGHARAGAHQAPASHHSSRAVAQRKHRAARHSAPAGANVDRSSTPLGAGPSSTSTHGHRVHHKKPKRQHPRHPSRTPQGQGRGLQTAPAQIRRLVEPGHVRGFDQYRGRKAPLPLPGPKR